MGIRRALDPGGFGGGDIRERDGPDGAPGGAVDGRTGPAGPPSGHDTLAKSVGLEGSVIENRDCLMSLGAALQPSYGAPFLWALRKVTRLDARGDSPPSREPRDRAEGA